MDADAQKLAKMIAEYDRLRKLLDDLDAQVNAVDDRPVAPERKLPNNYVSPDDPSKPPSS